MPKISLVTLFALTILFTLVAASGVSASPFQDNFEQYSIGTLPTGYTRSAGGRSFVEYDPLNPSNKAFHFNNGDIVHHEITVSTSFFFEFDNYFGTAGTYFGLNSQPDNTSLSIELLEAVRNGSVSNLTFLSKESQIVAQLENEQWHHFRIEGNRSGQQVTAEFYVDNVFLGMFSNAFSLVPPDLQMPYFSMAMGSGQVGDGYFDNISYDSSAPVPEPATMFLLASGLLGIAGFRRKLKMK